MESIILIRATFPEMNRFFESDHGVRWAEIHDSRYTFSDTQQIPDKIYQHTEFIWKVVYRHKQIAHPLHGAFSIEILKNKLDSTEEAKHEPDKK